MKSLQGQLLIASPKLLDPNFFKSVVLVVQHGDGGALGLILNRKIDVTLQTAWSQVSEEPCGVEGNLHQGGPCEGPLMVVHGEESLGQLEVLPGLHFSTERESIEELVGRNDGPMKFFVGYAGWAPGQLEGEIEEGSWLTTVAARDDVFRTDDRQWDEMMKRIARAATFPFIDPKLIPPDPSLN
jgi:putative transcriptional regulator